MDTRRREERIAVSLPVRIWGMDANHKPFTQTATTLDLTRAGVRIGGLNCQLQAGEVVGVQHGTDKARFRVVWAGKKGGSQQGQAGLVCVESAKYIWGVPLQYLAAASTPNFGPGQPPTSATSANTLSAEREKLAEKRGDARYPISGGVEVTNAENGARMWGVITDIGSTGCYVEMTTPPKAGTFVQLSMTVLGSNIHCTAEVRNSHLGVGMGLAFCEMNAEDHSRLEEVVAKLSSGATADSPARTEMVKNGAPSIADPKCVALADHIRSISSALRSIEDLIASAQLSIDDRVMREFRRTLDFTRQNAWSLQQWVEGGADPGKLYDLLDQLELRRIGAATDLTRELAMDVDANAVDIGTEGLAELALATDQLNRRFFAMKRGKERPLTDDEDLDTP